MKISTESYKGVRDFYPEDMFIEKYMFGKMREAAEKFGYVEYGASILELAELYRGKTSEEIVNQQTYTFTDRGGREVTLRPEMTPTVARMVASKRRELSVPIRWYSIPNVFRYEQPQRGRLREHWQLNVDIFGDASTEASIEVMSLANSLFISLGAKQSDFEILVNSRKVLDELWDKLKVNPVNRPQLTRLLDVKEKMSGEKFSAALAELLGKKDTKILIEALESTENFIGFLCNNDANEKSTAVKEIENLIERLQKNGIKNVKFSPTLARGFDYYTGIVFEIFDTDPKNRRSLAGGGSYDNLLKAFGSDPICAFGFGLGDVTLRDFLESHDLLPQTTSTNHLFLTILNKESGVSNANEKSEYGITVANRLRALGINVFVDHSERPIADRIKKALKENVPYFAVIGEDEMAKISITVKNLQAKTEKQFSLDETGLNSLAESLKNKTF